MNKLIVLVAMVPLALAGCGAQSAAKSPPDHAKNTAPSHTVTPKATTTPRSTTPAKPSDSGPAIGQFGGSFTYTNGVRVSVLRVHRGQVGPYGAGGHPGEPMAVFDVKLTNRTQRLFDPTLMTIVVSYGRAGKNADQVYDDGLDDGFQSKVLPGRTAITTVGFAMPAPGLNDVVVQVTPGFDYKDSFFEGSVRKEA